MHGQSKAIVPSQKGHSIFQYGHLYVYILTRRFIYMIELEIQRISSLSTKSTENEAYTQSKTSMQLSSDFKSFKDREGDVHFGDAVYVHAGKHAGKTGTVVHAAKKGKKTFALEFDGERGIAQVRQSSFYPVRKEGFTSVDRFFMERPHIEFHLWCLLIELRSARFSAGELGILFQEMEQHVIDNMYNPSRTLRSSTIAVVKEEDDDGAD